MVGEPHQLRQSEGWVTATWGEGSWREEEVACQPGPEGRVAKARRKGVFEPRQQEEKARGLVKKKKKKAQHSLSILAPGRHNL